MQPSFAEKLGFYFRKLNVSMPKIDGSRLEIFGIIIAFFLVDCKDRIS